MSETEGSECLYIVQDRDTGGLTDYYTEKVARAQAGTLRRWRLIRFHIASDGRPQAEVIEQN